VKYAFIEAHRSEFPVTLMCKVLGVSRSGFFDWKKRDPSKSEARKSSLVGKIEKIHLGSRKTYGSPRVYKTLKGLGEKCSKATVERLMRENGIRSKIKRKFKATTNSNHTLPVAPNLVKRDFTADAPNKLWCTDITYLWTEEGWLYLAAIIDVFTRKVVGWAMKDRLTLPLALEALEMAVRRQNPSPGLVHHSDRGCQYAAHEYRSELRRHGFLCSMSRRGQCWDNALAESFFHSLKTEHVYHERFSTRAQAKSSVFEWIEVFYNRQRIHSAIGFVSPACYERRAA
jgi:transposase InsO family protein